ncbi:hypothetical protein M3629_03740 [Paenibacillus polysaccharolyticus]|uniref:hypothetical protein n=1 Tax=Paenibacillus polysaccharolyticus TaxID=582692 RepID=UPI00203E27D9|nr:hypothetical protein [Paenibacillus polysaccharolyticus]MCM3131880.1 hypothetical protein [Paenibacillus polysaccharolyticus]
MLSRFRNAKTNRDVTVSDEKRLPVATTTPVDVVLADKVSNAGSAVYAAEVSKTVTLEFSGSTDTVTSSLTFQLKGPSGKGIAIEGIRLTAPTDVVTSGKLGEVVSFSVPAGFTLVINYTKPSTGTLSIKGMVE